MNKHQFIHAIERADLGALADDAMPIGDCLDVIYRAWRGHDEDIELPKDLGEQVWDALGELNRHYDENGCETDAPAALHARDALCDVLDEVAEVLDRISSRRDMDEENAVNDRP